MYVIFSNFANKTELECSGDQEYQVCGSSCETTCADLILNEHCIESCVEGCNCPEGLVLNSLNVCVPPSSCPCLNQGRWYEAGTSITHQFENKTELW